MRQPSAPSQLRRHGLSLLLLALIGASGWAEALPGGGADLQAARARLAKAATPADFASTLDSLSTDLSPADSLVLLNESLASVAPALRKPLLVKTAGLSLLTGLFVDAALRYEEAAAPVPGQGPDAALLLRSARCYLAAGDPDKASELGGQLLDSEPSSATPAKLVLGWARLLQARGGEAQALAADILALKDGARPEERREAGFLAWLSTSAEGKAQAAASLLAEFPGSPEALIAAGSLSPPPLPHWYLGGLALGQAPAPPALAPAPGAPAPAPATAAQAPAPAPGAPAAATVASAQAKPPAQAAQARRLQVGYFSAEQNAEALVAELGSKHFNASIQSVTRTAGDGVTQEKRWIVVVEGGNDLAKTRQALKDAGYESYLPE